VPRLLDVIEPDVEGKFRDEITICDACGESVFTFEQAEAHSRSYSAAVARLRNTLTPDRILDLRLSLGWPQTKMEEVFGVGPKTWGRWERGTVAPSGPAARLLWIAENDRDAFFRMAEGHDPRRQRNAKVVGVITPQGPGEQATGFSLAKPSFRKQSVAPGSNGSAAPGGPV
jgi:putative zinc finger/helix-turn-helix YgiT family protein